MKLINNLCPLSVLILIALIGSVFGGGAVDRDLSLTGPQKKALDEFKRAVEPLVDKEYKKGEIYLIKWLRGSNFDPVLATQKLEKNIKWRQEMNMETIHEEDWSDFRSQFEYDLDGIDNNGQPVLVADLGNWDFRQTLLSGKRPQLERYIFKMMDETSSKLRQLQHENKTVTRANMIVDLDGYSSTQQGCLPCISLYLTIATSFDSHFPELLDHMILINTPSIFELVLSVVKPALPQELQKSIVIYGTNRQEWKKYLSKLIPEDQLLVGLGGTKPKNYVF